MPNAYALIIRYDRVKELYPYHYPSGLIET